MVTTLQTAQNVAYRLVVRESTSLLVLSHKMFYGDADDNRGLAASTQYCTIIMY